MSSEDSDTPKYTTFVSSDGYRFIVLRSAALRAGMMRRMLDPRYGFKESVQNECHFPQIEGIVLEKLVEYLYYAEKFEGMTDVPDMDIPVEICMELADAADYVEC